MQVFRSSSSFNIWRRVFKNRDNTVSIFYLWKYSKDYFTIQMRGKNWKMKFSSKGSPPAPCLPEKCNSCFQNKTPDTPLVYAHMHFHKSSEKKSSVRRDALLSTRQQNLHVKSSHHSNKAPLVAAPADLPPLLGQYSSFLCLHANQSQLQKQFYWVQYLVLSAASCHLNNREHQMLRNKSRLHKSKSNCLTLRKVLDEHPLYLKRNRSREINTF